MRGKRKEPEKNNINNKVTLSFYYSTFSQISWW